MNEITPKAEDQPSVVSLPKEDIERIRKYLRTNAAKNTIRAYNGHWTRFEAYCAQRSVAPLSTDPQLICGYLTWLAEEARPGGYSYSYIQQARAALRKAHQLVRAGKRDPLPDPCEHPSVALVMESIARDLGTRSEGKSALSLEQIKLLISTMQADSDIRALRDRAMLLFGFFLALRRSEIVKLRVQDLTFGPQGATVRLGKTKSDQKGEGVILPLPRMESPEICPVTSLKAWMEAAGIHDGFLFRGINRHGKLMSQNLSAGYFVLRLKRAARESGLPYAVIAGHSLRAGFVTEASMQGVGITAVADVTRHKNLNNLKKYYRPGEIWRDPVAKKISTAKEE